MDTEHVPSSFGLQEEDTGLTMLRVSTTNSWPSTIQVFTQLLTSLVRRRLHYTTISYVNVF